MDEAAESAPPLVDEESASFLRRAAGGKAQGVATLRHWANRISNDGHEAAPLVRGRGVGGPPSQRLKLDGPLGERWNVRPG